MRWRRWEVATAARACAVVPVVAVAALLAAAAPASAEPTSGPVAFMDATEWTDCGNGFGGAERVSTVPSSAVAGHAVHEHRYCPTRPATVSYHFYAYDSADRNICALAESACDPALPYDAYAVITARWEPGDFDRAGACYPRGCALRAELPAGSATEVKNVVVEAIDDTGAYGLVHNVSWRAPLLATPLPEEPPAAEPAPVDPDATPEAPAPDARAPETPAPDEQPAVEGPVAEPPPAGAPPSEAPSLTAGAPE